MKAVNAGGRGRTSPSFVVAVQTTGGGHPQRLLLHVVKTHDGEAIEAMARTHLSPTARVVSDGLACFRAVTRIGCTHEPVIAAKLGWSEKFPSFRWVITVLGNLKTAIVGTLKSFTKRYLSRYFAEFQYRFNHNCFESQSTENHRRLAPMLAGLVKQCVDELEKSDNVSTYDRLISTPANFSVWINMCSDADITSGLD